MASSFNGTNYFGSGPHRFALSRPGRYLLAPFRAINQTHQHADQGKADLVIIQRGRLVSSNPSGLWGLIDPVRALAEAGTVGTLLDHHGRTYSGMKLAWMELEDRIDRGRQTSVGYTIFYFKNQ